MEKREKILVTGANGQLGNEFRDLAASFPQFDFFFTTRDELPVDDQEKVRGWFAAHQPRFCFNAAAYTAVDNAELVKEKHAVFGVNADAVKMLATVCRENDTRLIHVSTDYVFDGTTSRPYREDDPTHPINAYGASKLMGEQYALTANPDTIIIRSSWVYSAYGKNFVKTMLRLMNEKKEINVVNDQVGSPTYAHDLAGVMLGIIAKETDGIRQNWQPGIYHYTNEGAISWFDFALAIKELSGYTGKINPVSSMEYPTAARRPAYSVLDTSKIRETFQVKPNSWKESLAVCLTHIRKDQSS